MTEGKKIFAISLAGKSKAKAYAMYYPKEQSLVLVSIETIGGVFRSWEKKLIKEIMERKKDKFLISVEENTNHIAPYGTRMLFDTVDHATGLLNIETALKWYFSMKNMGKITLDKKLSKYSLHEGEGGKFETVYDDRGKPRIRVQMDALDGGPIQSNNPHNYADYSMNQGTLGIAATILYNPTLQNPFSGSLGDYKRRLVHKQTSTIL